MRTRVLLTVSAAVLAVNAIAGVALATTPVGLTSTTIATGTLPVRAARRSRADPRRTSACRPHGAADLGPEGAESASVAAHRAGPGRRGRAGAGSRPDRRRTPRSCRGPWRQHAPGIRGPAAQPHGLISAADGGSTTSRAAPAASHRGVHRVDGDPRLSGDVRDGGREVPAHEQVASGVEDRPPGGDGLLQAARRVVTPFLDRRWSATSSVIVLDLVRAPIRRRSTRPFFRSPRSTCAGSAAVRGSACRRIGDDDPQAVSRAELVPASTSCAP